MADAIFALMFGLALIMGLHSISDVVMLSEEQALRVAENNRKCAAAFSGLNWYGISRKHDLHTVYTALMFSPPFNEAHAFAKAYADVKR